MMTRVRKVFLSLGLVALLIGGAVTLVPPLLWGDLVDYSHVASIKDAREYQDPTLLEKAWKLGSKVSVLRDLDLASFSRLRAGCAAAVLHHCQLHRGANPALGGRDGR
jgi:hypothetical protein